MRRTGQGFTLIELLVAISVMALMAVLSWRGVDGISRSQERLQQRADEVLTLQATLTQWGSDLDAIVSQPGMPGLDWDGRALRILRRSSAAPDQGLVVVAWAQRNNAKGQGEWLRWQSPPLDNRRDLESAWQKATVWAQTPSAEDSAREVHTLPIDQWQVFYYRNNAWTNPLSSGDSTNAATTSQGTSAGSGVALTLPDGVRLALTLSAGQAVSGTLTRDWVSPLIGGGS
ncbi:prepilin-type N-terminal cleavage/methylation domain-containing protein [Rhodoferax sp.]|uniref:PulJ/GspJ family protein n=1 Tax=Rhodoferax sp. TaxID=50421 RepID=UPI00284D5CE0|nr:prepilin-type N-terminal cleavage/methylation domain-containing protein [Rhodoferax sp.]MDR3367580.1 prepilin-type N-terminal cleavage/methylation domain-containing protein [Rhodoferax sp.]